MKQKINIKSVCKYVVLIYNEAKTVSKESQAASNIK